MKFQLNTEMKRRLVKQTKRASLNEIVVRRIKKKDFAQFFDVVRRAFSNEIEIVGLDLHRFSYIVKFYNLIDPLSRLLDTLNVHSPTILVAVLKDDIIVGGVHIVPFGNGVWTIDSLAVDPNYGRFGIGARLISEALKYVWDGRGERALTYVRADNLPSLRIRKKLRGEFFDRRVLLLSEMNKNFDVNPKSDFFIREVKAKDLSQVYKLCHILDSKKAVAFRIAPEKFLYSPLERLLSKLGFSFSKRLVMETHGKIVGYVHLTYASSEEAAKIESFYVVGPSDLYYRTALLLRRVFDILQKRNIKKVTVSLSEDLKETIQILESLGFKKLASFYGIAHELA